MALAAGRIPKPKSIKNLTPEKFFELIDRALDQCRIYKKHCLRIANCNMHLALCKTVRGMESLDAMLLLYMCRELVISGSGIISEMKINRFLRNFPYSNRNMVIRKLRGGKHTLVERGFVEFAGNGLFGECAEFSLTKKAREEFLEGLEIYEQDGENKKNLIRWQDICDKELFYNAGESQSIAEITSLFAPESFAAVRRRLEERGRAPGFACLFFGPPGTGKTASVYAIARAAKRDIVQVNIAETKSMWFGKSEKIMKGIFDDYRRIVERRRLKGENIPVLFFNEADAIFSKRLPLGDERNGPAQTENAIQNILLDEMEKIDGILLATTNLTGNFDTAFERRFLYKIEFSKPDSGVRSSIWNTLIPELDNTACAALARKYDFSGGQIDNIA
jgi:hypothetical protein